MSAIPTIRQARLTAADVRVYCASLARDVVGMRRGARSAQTPWLSWLSARSDEFIAAVDPGGVALEPAEVEALIARVRAC